MNRFVLSLLVISSCFIWCDVSLRATALSRLPAHSITSCSYQIITHKNNTNTSHASNAKWCSVYPRCQKSIIYNWLHIDENCFYVCKCNESCVIYYLEPVRPVCWMSRVWSSSMNWLSSHSKLRITRAQRYRMTEWIYYPAKEINEID